MQDTTGFDRPNGSCAQIPEAYNNLGTRLKEQGLAAEACRAFKQALSLRPSYRSAHSNLLFTLQYLSGQTLGGLQAAHQDWAKQQLDGIVPRSSAAFESKTSSLIVVGLISPDLYAHPVGVFLLPWLDHRDRQQFKLIAYADSESYNDPIALRIQAAVDLWRPISGQSDEVVDQQIIEDGVDILIDLAGHTAGNRLGVFAKRAAPIQVSWLGYSATTGVPEMDAVLMDSYIAPAGIEEHFTEKLIRLDGLRFCYTPPSYAPPLATLPCLYRGHITYGSFNNLAKLTPEVIKIWAEILVATPTSRLILKWKSLGDPDTKSRIQKAFADYGISSKRIDCRGWSGHTQMLTEYNDIDIALDPFPFSGGLTSCDALFMGVPILTLPGALPISRQTASFMDALGLSDWVTTSQKDYIEKAAAFAANPVFLQSVRHVLRRKMLKSRLCNGLQYARSIEAALTELISTRTSFKIIN